MPKDVTQLVNLTPCLCQVLLCFRMTKTQHSHIYLLTFSLRTWDHFFVGSHWGHTAWAPLSEGVGISYQSVSPCCILFFLSVKWRQELVGLHQAVPESRPSTTSFQRAEQLKLCFFSAMTIDARLVHFKSSQPITLFKYKPTGTSSWQIIFK